MKVLVVGATGGSGRAAVTELVGRGHDVTALSRHASSLPGVRGIDGDATDAATVDRLVQGQDAVVVTLGISESAVRVRLRGPSGTPLDIRSRGTRTVLAAMHRHGVRKVVVQTSYGVGPTSDTLPLANRLIFALLLRPQIADTERQGTELRASGLDWVEVQPVTLTDEPWAGLPTTSTDGSIDGTRVSRAQVGWFLAQAVEDPSLTRQTVSVSAGAAVPVTV